MNETTPAPKMTEAEVKAMYAEINARAKVRMEAAEEALSPYYDYFAEVLNDTQVRAIQRVIAKTCEEADYFAKDGYVIEIHFDRAGSRKYNGGRPVWGYVAVWTKASKAKGQEYADARAWLRVGTRGGLTGSIHGSFLRNEIDLSKRIW